ncbi:MAG: precorrin-4 C(11)-methyltransferase [Victivallales bacterium]|nr:precorrin-4 C(11)-methyltransferase [Victivallales bacterium]
MSGKITFVGAGPGAPDLITLRGAKALAEADIVVYAGSLVNEKILETASGAELFNSAKLSLPEVLSILTVNYRAGKNVVRLHTGDPAMYGAVAEQYRELDKLSIPYEVVPGVSSVFAAAAELKIELTMPDLSQTVILTREAGRTPVPEKENIEALAEHDSTLCIFLSVNGIHELTGKLINAGRAPATPAAVVYRASWDNQKIVRGTLADIADKVIAAGIKRQSMIIVGDVLERNGEVSRLYDASFSTGYRHGGGTHGYKGKIALFALTRNGAYKAAEIAAGMDDATLIMPEKYAAGLPSMRLETYDDGDFSKTFASAWERFDALVMVMAAGIAVRHAGKLCQDKKYDPAIVVCDEAGNYAISLLSGHIGGANTLARDIARVTGGKAVITTASDVRGIPALDEFAARNHYRVVNPEILTRFAGTILEKTKVELEMPLEVYEREFAFAPGFELSRERKDGIIMIHVGNMSLELHKQVIALGIGCRKGVSAKRLEEVINDFLSRYGFTMSEITFLASVELKAEETGLLEFARKTGKELRLFSKEQLNSVEVPHPSEAARKQLGVNSVSEASALLAAGSGAQIRAGKYADENVTAAIAVNEAP